MKRLIFTVLLLGACGGAPITIGDAGPPAGDAAPQVRDGGASDAGATSNAPLIAFAIVSAAGSTLHTVRADSTGLTPLPDGRGNDFSPVFAPDGVRFAFASNRTEQAGLYVFDLASSRTTSISTGALVNATSPSWHPTRDELALEGTAMTGRPPDVYSVTLDGTLEQLTDDPAVDVGPVWAPNGTIIFTSNRSGRYELYRLDVTTRMVQQLTTMSAIVGRATISPDGCEIVFARSTAPGDAELVSLAVCGAPAQPVPLMQDGSEPVFAASGEAMVFATSRFGGSNLMYWPRRAETPVRLTTGVGLATQPALSTR